MNSSSPHIDAESRPSKPATPLLAPRATSGLTEDRIALWVVIALTAMALGVRLWRADQQLWYDEIVSVLDTIRMPVGELARTYTWDNQHTLYSMLAHGAVQIYGESAATVRLPAIIAGALTIPALYWLGRMLLPTWYAVAACAILTLSYHHVWFSQNARGYTNLLLATLLSTGCLFRLLSRPRWVWGLGIVLATSLGAYTHMSMVFVALGQGIVVAWILGKSWWRKSNIAPPMAAMAALVASGVVTVLLHLPMLDEMIEFHSSERNVAAEEWKQPLYAARETLAGLKQGLGIAPLAVAAVLGAVGIAGQFARHPRMVSLMLLPAFMTLAVALALGHSIRPRFFFYASGFAVLLLVGGVHVWVDLVTRRLKPPTRNRVALELAAITMLLLLAAELYQLPRAYLPKQDFASAIQFIEENRGPGDAVLVAGMAAKPLRQYYRLDWTEALTAQDVRTARRNHSAIWLVHTMPSQLRSSVPEVSAAAEEFERKAIFPGTLGEGEMYVLRAEPIEKSPARIEDDREAP